MSYNIFQRIIVAVFLVSASLWFLSGAWRQIGEKRVEAPQVKLEVKQGEAQGELQSLQKEVLVEKLSGMRP